MQIDQGANKHHNLVIMFAAGNDGDDYDGNGEIGRLITALGSISQELNHHWGI